MVFAIRSNFSWRGVCARSPPKLHHTHSRNFNICKCNKWTKGTPKPSCHPRSHISTCENLRENTRPSLLSVHEQLKQFWVFDTPMNYCKPCSRPMTAALFKLACANIFRKTSAKLAQVQNYEMVYILSIPKKNHWISPRGIWQEHIVFSQNIAFCWFLSSEQTGICTAAENAFASQRRFCEF